MAIRRTIYVEQLARRVGSTVMQVIDVRDGWPALCRVRIGTEWINVALHVGLLGKTGRGRDDRERRFQNPADRRPVLSPAGYRPALVGLQIVDGSVSAVAGMDAVRRVGKRKRVSLFTHVDALDEVNRTGWVEHSSSSGEIIHVFRPELLPVFVAMRNQDDVVPEVPAIVEASGLIGADPSEQDAAGERARRACLRAVRSRAFSQKVIGVYADTCAMCGLDEGLVQAAHILPVQAPGSPDALWNGMALCPNHHGAFDLHKLHVDPATGRISAHPQLVRAADGNQACKAMIDCLRDAIALPLDPAAKPRSEMFERRYEFFHPAYGWAPR